MLKTHAWSYMYNVGDFQDIPLKSIVDKISTVFTWTFHALGQISHACQTLSLFDVPDQLKEFPQ